MPPINPSPDPLTNKSSNLKKLFIVIGVVTFFGAIATGTFVYTSRNNNLDLSSADKAIALLSKTDKPPTQEEKDFTQAFGKILDSSNSKTGILEFNFMESRTNGQYFFYNIASSFWKATIKVECPRSVVARGRDGYGRFYDLADSKSPCSSDVEFISPNFGNDGINNGATNDVNNGSEIKVPGSTDAVQFFMVDKNTTKINLPTTLKVCDKSGKCLEKMTNIILPSSAQNSGASPSNSTGNVTPAIPKGVTTRMIN